MKKKIKQLNKNDCVISCLHYLIDVDYNKLKSNLGIGVNIDQVSNYLNSLNIKNKNILMKSGFIDFYKKNAINNDIYNNDCIKYSLNKNLKSIVKNKKAIATIKKNNNYHCVVIENNKVLDPFDSKIYDLFHYDILDILIIEL